MLRDFEAAPERARRIDRPHRREHRNGAVEAEEQRAPSEPERPVGEHAKGEERGKRREGKHERQVQRLRLRKPLGGRKVELREEERGRAASDLADPPRLPVAHGLDGVDL